MNKDELEKAVGAAKADVLVSFLKGQGGEVEPETIISIMKEALAHSDVAAEAKDPEGMAHRFLDAYVPLIFWLAGKYGNRINLGFFLSSLQLPRLINLYIGAIRPNMPSFLKDRLHEYLSRIDGFGEIKLMPPTTVQEHQVSSSSFRSNFVHYQYWVHLAEMVLLSPPQMDLIEQDAVATYVGAARAHLLTDFLAGKAESGHARLIADILRDLVLIVSPEGRRCLNHMDGAFIEGYLDFLFWFAEEEGRTCNLERFLERMDLEFLVEYADIERHPEVPAHIRKRLLYYLLMFTGRKETDGPEWRDFVIPSDVHVYKTTSQWQRLVKRLVLPAGPLEANGGASGAVYA